MATRDILKYLNLFVDGRGYAGEIEEFTPPTLAIQTEDFRAGGMDTSTPIDMGMDKLEASFSMGSMASEIQKVSLTRGANVPLVMRGALESRDGTVKAVVYTMRGRIRQIEEGALSGGSKPSLTYTVDLVYFKKEIAGESIHEIDVENMIRIIDGVDQLAEHRNAIGL